MSLSKPSSFSQIFGCVIGLGLTLTLCACGEDAEEVNQPPALADATAPERLDEAQIVTTYTIADAEGDDQRLRVRVCAADGSACGAPFQGVGGDGADDVPTDATGRAELRRFVWAVGCGRVTTEGAVIATSITDSYTITIASLATPPAETTTPAFTLSALGFTEVPACARTGGS